MRNKEMLSQMRNDRLVDFLRCTPAISSSMPCSKMDSCKECKLIWLEKEASICDILS